MSIECHQLSRRRVLKAAATSGGGLLAAISGVCGLAAATAYETSSGTAKMDALITALKSIGKPVCLDAADNLESFGANTPSFDLHLRRAGLDALDANILAKAIRETTMYSEPVLRSFSASYNAKVTDAGVIALADAFPLTMAELGLVGCSIGDAGGLAILEWAKRAANPRMICIEANGFSNDIRSRFEELSRQRKSLMVVI